ncbi:hypothetical protein ACHAPT_006878 [Fusarium lateritium]
MPLRGACDSCKRRKVKCDNTDFCANCRLSQLRCQRTIPRQRRGRRVTNKPSDESAAAVEDTIPCAASRYDASDGDHGRDRTVSALDHGSQEAQDRSHTHLGLLHDESTNGIQQTFPSLSPPGPGVLGSAIESYCENSRQIHMNLLAAVSPVLPAEALLDAVHHYIDLFMQYHFSNSPIIFESTLRAHASLLRPPDDAGSTHQLYSLEPSTQLASMKGFAIITAMCASITSVMPASLVSDRQLLSVSFLHASRAMLRLYEDNDLEHPDSSSLIIRQWHCVALQNTTGKTGSAWHYHGEATLLAQRLRLYNEGSVRRIPGRESQLQRACFWQLYLTDIAGVATGTRIPVLSEALFDGGLTLRERGDRDEALLDPSRSCNQGSLEDRLVIGFHFKIRMWSLATSIIRGIKAILEHQESSVEGTSRLPGASEPTHLIEAYLAYTGLMDDLPTWLQRPDTAPESVTEEVCAYQKTCFWVQRCSIMSAFHCLKLIILQCCVEFGTPAIMGFSNHATSLAMKKIEIAHDFLQDLLTVPFLCLKIQGEPAVQRIRRVGTIVLQVGQTVRHETIKARSETLLTHLLDLLAKLDSKASDSI